MSGSEKVQLQKLDAKSDPRMPYGGQWLHSLGAPPSHADWYSQVKVWPTGAKDGNSSAMAAANAVAQWTSYSDRGATVLAPEQVEHFGSTFSGDEPAEMLKSWMLDGVEGRKLLAAGWVNSQNPNEIRASVAPYANALVELNMPESAKAQQVWQESGEEGEHTEPGSWGVVRGLVVGFDPEGVVFAGLDARRRMSWGFLTRYATRAWVMLDQSFIDASGMVPGGFDRAVMAAQMQPLVEDWPVENGVVVDPRERERQKRQQKRTSSSTSSSSGSGASSATTDLGITTPAKDTGSGKDQKK